MHPRWGVGGWLHAQTLGPGGPESGGPESWQCHSLHLSFLICKVGLMIAAPTTWDVFHKGSGFTDDDPGAGPGMQKSLSERLLS